MLIQILEYYFQKFDSGSKNDASGSELPGATTSLKLFGRTVLVTDSRRPSSSPTVTGKPLAAECSQVNVDDSEPGQTYEQNQTGNVYSMGSSMNTWNSWPHGNPSMFYQMQFQHENPNAEGASAVPIPWWPLQGGIPFSILPSFNQSPIQMLPRENSEERDSEDKEGSAMGSSTSSVSDVETLDRCGDIADSKNNQHKCFGQNLSRNFVLKPSKRSAFSQPRANPKPCIKGFVPYKRCLAEEDQSSNGVREERDGRRIRVCS